MSKKLTVNYHSETCKVCGTKLKIIEPLDEENFVERKMTKEQIQEFLRLANANSETYTYGQYVLRAGTLAALQMGYLCSVCSQKELKDRIKIKF